MRKDEDAVFAVQDLLHTVISPFSLTTPSSGTEASADVKDDLFNAHFIGEEQFSTFIKTRLVENTVDMFSTVKGFKLKTFASVPKKKPGQLKSIKSD